MKKLLSIVAIFVFGLSLNAQLDRSTPPSAKPNPEIKFDIPDPLVFGNGLKVILVENHKLPVVSFQLFIDHPTIAEGNKVGLNAMFGEMMSTGTTTLSKDNLDGKIDFMGADLFTNSRGLFASSLKKHTPELLALIKDIILNPSFPQEEFDRIKEQTISSLAVSKNDPNTMAANVGGVVNYGSEHPYGEVMTEETLENITLDDIRAHYKKFFIPNNAYLVIVGDFTTDDAKSWVEEYFMDWKKGDEIKSSTYRTPQASGNNVYFIDKPGAVQSVIKITHNVDIKPGSEDVLKLMVFNKILGGGGFAARLMANLREDKAYTYGCYSSFSPDKMIGEFSAGGAFRNEVTDSAIVQILFEISNIVENGVTPKELDLAKKSMTGSFARSLENSQTIARFALNTARYDLPKDYYSNYLKRLEAITVQDIKEIAVKYLHPKNLNIIVAGNSEIIDKLAVFDTDGGISLKDQYGQDAMMLKTAPEGVTAESIVQNYLFKTYMVDNQTDLDAKLSKIGFIQVVSTSYIEEMDATLTMTVYKGRPNKFAMIMKVSSPGQNMIMQKDWFNGEEGATFAMGAGKTKYEGEELEDKKKPNFPSSRFFYFTDNSINVELMGIDEIDAKEYYKLKISEEGETDFSFEYYSLETGMLEMEESFSTDEEGNANSVMITYSDFKDYGKGIIMPHTSSMNTGQQIIKFEIASVKVKKKAKSKAFEGEFK